MIFYFSVFILSFSDSDEKTSISGEFEALLHGMSLIIFFSPDLFLFFLSADQYNFS